MSKRHAYAASARPLDQDQLDEIDLIEPTFSVEIFHLCDGVSAEVWKFDFGSTLGQLCGEFPTRAAAEKAVKAAAGLPDCVE